MTGIRAGFDGAADFEVGGRRNGVCRANRLGARDELGGSPISCRKKKNGDKRK